MLSRFDLATFLFLFILVGTYKVSAVVFHITCTFPRLDMNLRRVNINASVDKSLANSIWTPRPSILFFSSF